jgi:hypothetical protein
MTKEFLTYELALKLKEVGFNEPCMGYYDCERDLKLVPNKNKFLSCEYAAPLYQQVFRWFREKYDIDISIITIYSKYNENKSKKYRVVIDNKTVFTNVGFYETYEEAELACLNKLIMIVKLQTTLNHEK